MFLDGSLLGGKRQELSECRNRCGHYKMPQRDTSSRESANSARQWYQFQQLLWLNGGLQTKTFSCLQHLWAAAVVKQLKGF